MQQKEDEFNTRVGSIQGELETVHQVFSNPEVLEAISRSYSVLDSYVALVLCLASQTVAFQSSRTLQVLLMLLKTHMCPFLTAICFSEASFRRS